MDNMTLLIDPETRDLVFDDSGMLIQIFAAETTIQNVRHSLLAWKGEFFADDEHGTDYARVVGKTQNEIDIDEIEEIVRDAIFQEPDVKQITSLDISYKSRVLDIQIAAILDNDEKITMEVVI